MKYLKIIGLIFLVISFASCEKDECECTQITNPEDERFPVNYHFINTTENKLRALNFKVRTFYPSDYYGTNLKYTHFPDVFPYDTITMTIDTTGGIGSFGYIGCETQMQVNVYLDINDTLTYVSTWHTKTDIINCKADADIFFFWPNDTLYAEKILNHTYVRKNKSFEVVVNGDSTYYVRNENRKFNAALLPN